MLAQAYFKPIVRLLFYTLIAPLLLLSISNMAFSSPKDFLRIEATRAIMIDPYGEDDIVPRRVGAKAEYYNLASLAKYLLDPTGSLTIDDVASSDKAQAFKSNNDEIINFGITPYTYWVKFQLHFPLQNLSASRHKTWLLEVGRAQLDSAELYTPNDSGGFDKLKSDVSVKMSERFVQSAHSVFPIEISAGEKKTFYLRVASNNALFLPLNLWDRVSFLEKIATQEYLSGAFFGAMIILVFYNFFMFLSVADKSYLYYSLCFFFLTIFQFLELGHGFTLFGDATQHFQKELAPYILWSSWALVILFTQSFLDTKNKYPSIDFILRMTLVVGIAHVLLSFSMAFIVTQIWLSGFSIAIMVQVACISYYAWTKGDQSAFFFLLPWVVGILGGITYTLVLLGMLPTTPLFIYSAPLGTLACSILLSFALTDRIRRMRQKTLNANQQAMASLSKFESLFNNAVEGMYRMDLDGRLVGANPAMANLMGFANVRTLLLNSATALDYLFPHFHDELEELLELGKVQRQTSYELLTSNVVWVTHTAQVIYDEQGDPSHIEGTLIDITTRVERELAEKESELESIERQVAEASAAAKSSFLANMSHEIRTPLTAIIGYSEILADPSLDKKESDQSLDTVIRSGHHLLELINDILDISNIEAQRLEVSCKPLDIFTLIRDVEAYFSLKAEEKNITFNIDYEFPLPSLIIADLTRLKQILLNLCSNAIKFTKEGGVTLAINWDEQSQLMSFSVKDTGIGLTESQRNKLFQAYSQAEASTSREFGGTGLGLVISKQLAEMMGGDIRVTSEPGKGSCFTTTIGGGLAEGHRWIYSKDQIKVEELEPEISGGNLPQLVGDVLIAEDNADNRYLLKLMLNKTGVNISFVENGLKAVEHVQENAVSMVLMDMHMPVMNGMDATQAIRALGLDVPVVAISAGVLEDDIRAYREAGCDDVLAKPIDRTDFYQVMMKYLGDRQRFYSDQGNLA